MFFNCLFRRISILQLALFQQKACPEDSCSYLNKITFNWFHSLAARGFRRPLEVDDLWRLRLHEESENLMKKFKRHWVPAVNGMFISTLAHTFFE